MFVAVSLAHVFSHSCSLSLSLNFNSTFLYISSLILSLSLSFYVITSLSLQLSLLLFPQVSLSFTIQREILSEIPIRRTSYPMFIAVYLAHDFLRTYWYNLPLFASFCCCKIALHRSCEISGGCVCDVVVDNDDGCGYVVIDRCFSSDDC